jgi:hypothetical protein
MDQTRAVGTALVGLVAATIGAAAGLIASYITARQQKQLDIHRLTAELAAEREREVRLAVGEFAAVLSRAIQVISWFTWQAAHRVAVVSPAWMDAYDSEMRNQLPLVMAALSRVAALSPPAFQGFNPLVVEMFDIDASVGRAGSAIIDEPEAARARIAEFDDTTDRLFERFQNALATWAG